MCGQLDKNVGNLIIGIAFALQYSVHMFVPPCSSEWGNVIVVLGILHRAEAFVGICQEEF